MKSKLAIAAVTIALTGLIPGSSRGAEISDCTNVNEPTAASETRQATEPLDQQMTAQGQDLWQLCQTEVNGAPLWAMQKTGAGPLDPVWGYAMCNNVTQEIACPRKSGRRWRRSPP